MAVHVVVRDSPMHATSDEIRQPADGVDITGLVENRALLEGESASFDHLLTDRFEVRIGEPDRSDRIGDVIDHEVRL